MERPETACEDSGRVGGETISERPEEVGNSNRPQGNESPERYSISFRLYIQTIREGRVTGWRETLSGGIVSSLSVPLSMVGSPPRVPEDIGNRRETPSDGIGWRGGEGTRPKIHPETRSLDGETRDRLRGYRDPETVPPR